MINKYLPQVKTILPSILDLAMPLALFVVLIVLISAGIKLLSILKRAGFLNKANILLLLLWFGVLFALGGWSTTSSYCASCHVMRAEGKIWRESTHKNISCHECHRDRGIAGFTFRKIAEFRMVLVTATGRYLRPVRSNIPDYRCLNCHNDVLEGTIESKGIKVKHSDFAVKDWRCYECHVAIAHGAAVPLPNPPIMTRCVTCHNGKTASADCKICHTDTNIKNKVEKWDPWEKAHGEGWERGHGVVDSRLCVVCHNKSYCSSCHIQMPHPSSFKELHGREAKKDNAGCQQCHAKSGCDNCHGLELPHPKQFNTEHFQVVKDKGDVSCKRCHTERSCNDCHAIHFYHPNNKTRL